MRKCKAKRTVQREGLRLTRKVRRGVLSEKEAARRLALREEGGLTFSGALELIRNPRRWGS